MKRTTATRPSGSLGATRPSTSSTLPPPHKKSKLLVEGHEEGTSRREGKVLKKGPELEKEGEKEREAAFMSSLLADLDDDFWTAPPSSSPRVSPSKKRGPLGAGSANGTVRDDARWSATSLSTHFTNVSVRGLSPKAHRTSPTSPFRGKVTPVKATSTERKFPVHSSKSDGPQPLASTSTSLSGNPSASSSSSSKFLSTSKPIAKSIPAPAPASTSTSTGFDIQAFLQGSEDWDLSDGGLSPVKPVVKPFVHPQPVVAKTIATRTHETPNPCTGRKAEQKGAQKQGSRYMEMEKYTPDLCTRCVVLSVDDVCVDSGEDGKGRKRWEKRIRAHARVQSSRDTSPNSDKQKEKEEVEVEVVLCDGWYETDVRVDDVFNVIGHFTPALTSPVTSTPTSTPTIHISFTNHNSLLILHPDVLLTATALSSAAQCARKPVLSGLVRQSASGVMGSGDDNKASPAMVYGNILHEVLDRCLVANRWGGLGGTDTQSIGGGKGGEDDAEDDGKWMNRCIDEAIHGSLGELVRLGLEEEEVRREIRERARGFGVFAKRYLGSVPKQDGVLNNTRTLAHDAPSRLAITHLLDIEEDIWSPAYGIKGKIDAVVRGIIDDPVPAEQGPLYNSGLTRRDGHQANRHTRTQRHTPLPLELKTGRVHTGMDHRAQTMLYTLLLSERYHVDVRDGLLFYSRLQDSENGKVVGEDMVRVPRGWNEIRGLIGLRNTLAGYIWRRIRKRKDAVGEVADDEILNRKEDYHIEKEPEIEEDFLPPPIDDEWTCKRCYSLETCLLFRKTHPPLSLSSQSQGSQTNGSNHRSVPALPPPGRLRQLFDAHTAHLTPARVDFFRKWEALLALEERDMVRFKRELWVLGAREREKKGRCLGGMRVVGLGPNGGSIGAGVGVGVNALGDVEDDIEGGDEGKRGKEGKIYRFVYTFEKDLDFSRDGGEDDNLSLRNTHLVKGDPITVSLMSPRQVLALARGYILDFQIVPSPECSSSSPLSDSDSNLSELKVDEDEDATMVLDFGLGINTDTEDRERARERKRKQRRADQNLRGRVVVGVDHSLHPWLDGGLGDGTPLGLGLHKNHAQQRTSAKSRITGLQPTQQQRAIFRIDKDELFGGMSRVRENLASLFYASGPVFVPHPTPNASNGQVTTTAKVGRGNKKLLELVVDLRAPEFDECHEVDEEEEKGVDIHNAEARYLKNVASHDTIPSVEPRKSQEPNIEQPESQNQQRHEQQLNTAQSLAIQRALSARDYALILGMPGTGKTCVIAALVKELVFGSPGSFSSTLTSVSGLTSQSQQNRRPKTVLISSYTHSAVDSILRKLVEGGGWDVDVDADVDVDGTRGKRAGGIVRLGNVEKIHPEVRRFSPTFSKGKQKEMTAEDLEGIYMNASVVATTCLGLDHPLFSRRRFDYCILDEASQITLPTCLGPLRFADVFVLVGDHHQLPPLVKNPLARPPLPTHSGSGSPLTIEALTSTPSLTTSLFLLLSTAHPESVVELTEQYRMNEDIMTISNELVYGGRMQCGVDSGGVLGLNDAFNHEQGDFLNGVHRAAGAGTPQVGQEDKEEDQGPMIYTQCRGAEGGDNCWLEQLCDDRTKAIFINTDALPSARESRVGDLVQNLGEATLVAQFVETLRRKGVHGSRVGVVTLYRQQVKVLEGLLNGVDKMEGNAVEIMTADKSQGRDKDCVVVSLVRSNDAGSIGDLVKDWRRINVSFTRARCKLVIFGSRQTLEREPMLGRFFELMDRKGWVLDLKEGAERAHERVWTWPNGVDGAVGAETAVVGKKRRLGDEDEDKKGKTKTQSGRTKENDLAPSPSLWNGEKVEIGPDMEKATSSRPAKRVRLEDKPDALLRGRPVLRDLVGNEMCL